MNFSRISNLEKSFSCFQGFQIWKSFPWTTQSKHLILSLDFRARYLWQLKCSVGFFFGLNHLSFLTSTQHGTSVVTRFIICESIFFCLKFIHIKFISFFSFTCTNSIQQVYLKSKGCNLESVSVQHLFFSYFEFL